MRRLTVFLVLFASCLALWAGATGEKGGAADAAATGPKEAVQTEVGKYIDPKVPKSWYEAPKLASQAGVKSYKESPMLAERVKAGKLPAVKDRLPADPPVIEPYAKVGRYGGTAVVWAEPNYRGDTMFFKWPEHQPGPGRPTPDGQKTVPFILEGWSYSPDFTQMTIKLRKGLKWSDGAPFTTADLEFWWDHVAFNKSLTPTPPDKIKPIPMTGFKKVNDYEATFIFAKPNPRFHDYNFYANLFPIVPIPPAHYLKAFHPDFTPVEKITEMAKKVGLKEWWQYYLRVSNDSHDHPEWEHQKPVISPYVVTERTETYMMWERNPYWPFVDTQGNQLPYIDKVRVNIATNGEIAAAKMVTGEAHLSGRFTQTPNIPLYKANEQKSGYQTYIYSRAYGSDVVLLLNLSHEDPDMYAVFNDVRFRRALSYAMDRKEINDKVYFGQAVVMQATIPPTSRYFKPEYAKAYVEYKPDESKRLLDEMGMKDKDGDGWRETPTGKKFSPQMIFAVVGTVDPSPVVELIKAKFDAVGVKFDTKLVARSLHDTFWPTNKGDAHALLMDQMTDTSFGGADRDLAPAGADTGKDTPWPGWRTYYVTNGEKGVEPPAQMKQLNEYRDILGTDIDPKKRDEAADKLLKAQAENLWYIGTVSMAPQPIMVSNKLKNVPIKGIWDWRTGYMYVYYPMQWYLEE